MMPKSTYRPRRSKTGWLRLLAAAICLTVLLAACGGGSSSANITNTGSTPTPTTVANTPTPTAGAPGATPTPQTTPLTGLTQVVLIVNASNGSYGFTPQIMTIKVGTTVTWKNMSSAPHTVTS